MFFSPENVEDISKYYRHTFLKLQEFGDKLFYIDGVDRFMVSGRTEDGQEFRLYMSSNSPYTVEYILPHKSFFQYDDHAVMLERIPARQYHRGLCSENTALRYWKANGDVGQVELGFTALKAYVSKQKFFSLAEAVKSLKQSCALTSRMMYVPTMRQLFVDFLPVASVDGNQIAMIQPIFKYEVKKMLEQKHDFSFTVV